MSTVIQMINNMLEKIESIEKKDKISKVKIPIKIKYGPETVPFDCIDLEKKSKPAQKIPLKMKFKPQVPKFISAKKYQLTQYYGQLLTNDESMDLYHYLLQTINWEKGIYSRRARRHTRLAKALSLSDNDRVQCTVLDCAKRMGLSNHIIFGVYLNYYRDGQDYTPQHKHENTIQMVISLNESGGDRDLIIGKTKYHQNNGDVIIFGASVHGVPQQPNSKGRISIATFMKYDAQLGGQVIYQ